MPTNLDTPNPAMDQEAIDELQVNNVKKLRTTLNRMGVTQLLLVENKTSTNFTSTTLTVPVNMQGVITTTGGWVDIEFKMPMALSGAIDIAGRLLIDGNVMDFEQYTTPGFSEVLILSWHGQLGQGRHNVAVNFAVGSGTAAISTNSSVTRLQAWESIVG